MEHQYRLRENPRVNPGKAKKRRPGRAALSCIRILPRLLLSRRSVSPVRRAHGREQPVLEFIEPALPWTSIVTHQRTGDLAERTRRTRRMAWAGVLTEQSCSIEFFRHGFSLAYSLLSILKSSGFAEPGWAWLCDKVKRSSLPCCGALSGSLVSFSITDVAIGNPSGKMELLKLSEIALSAV
jgi:hypothetical protein